MIELSRTYTIEAAHRLPNAPEDHKCRRLHGHSFRITVYVRGAVQQPEGWVVDFAEIDEAFRAIHETLDHRYLNEIPGLENPTSENLAQWIWGRLEIHSPASAVEVAETCTSSCHYRPE